MASRKLDVVVTWGFMGRQEEDLRTWVQKPSLLVYSVDQPAQIEERAEPQTLTR